MTGMDVTALKQNALARVADFDTTVPGAGPPAPSGCPLQPAHAQLSTGSSSVGAGGAVSEITVNTL